MTGVAGGGVLGEDVELEEELDEDEELEDVLGVTGGGTTGVGVSVLTVLTWARCHESGQLSEMKHMWRG